MILTFATAFRPNFLKMPREAWLAEVNKTPLKRRAEYKRSVIEHGLDSEFVSDAIAQHNKLLSWMDESLQSGRCLAGDNFSNAECAVIPYILRLDLIPGSAIGGRACASGLPSRRNSSVACPRRTGRRSAILRPIPGPKCNR
jgi:glutathione S-transferase